MRRRRQGRKSPGNNSSAQEAAAWPGAACGAGPAGRGLLRLLLLLPKAQPGWGHGQVRGGGGTARCGNTLSRSPEPEDVRDGSPSSQGKPSGSPPPPYSGLDPGRQESAAWPSREAWSRERTPRRKMGPKCTSKPSHSLCSLCCTGWLPFGLKRKLFSRPSEDRLGWSPGWSWEGGMGNMGTPAAFISSVTLPSASEDMSDVRLNNPNFP